MENKKDIFIALYDGEFSFKEMPQMKVLDITIQLNQIKAIIEDFDPSLDRGITGSAKTLNAKTIMFSYCQE